MTTTGYALSFSTSADGGTGGLENEFSIFIICSTGETEEVMACSLLRQ